MPRPPVLLVGSLIFILSILNLAQAKQNEAPIKNKKASPKTSLHAQHTSKLKTKFTPQPHHARPHLKPKIKKSPYKNANLKTKPHRTVTTLKSKKSPYKNSKHPVKQRQKRIALNSKTNPAPYKKSKQSTKSHHAFSAQKTKINKLKSKKPKLNTKRSQAHLISKVKINKSLYKNPKHPVKPHQSLVALKSKNKQKKILSVPVKTTSLLVSTNLHKSSVTHKPPSKNTAKSHHNPNKLPPLRWHKKWRKWASSSRRQHPHLKNKYTSVLEINVGTIWTSPGETQTFYLQPDVQKTYEANPTQQTLAEGEIFGGWQTYLDRKAQFTGQFGLSFAGTSLAHLNGNIWEDADPEFNNYTYAYQVGLMRLALKGKLLSNKYRMVLPYVSGSVGIGFNRAQNFVITPIIIEEVPAPFFTNSTQVSFSYSVGAGFQKSFHKHFQAILGYEFVDWGKSQLGNALGQTLNTGLKLDHLYTNGVKIGVQYTS